VTSGPGWNTEHPHVHVIIRGRTDDGQDLVISRDYIREGMRAQAEGLVTRELGPRSEQEIRRSLEGEIEAEHWTRLDRALAREAATNRGIIDLRPDRYRKGDDLQTIKIGRMRRLERLGVAHQAGLGQWTLAENAEPTLRALGERNDIIKRGPPRGTRCTQEEASSAVRGWSIPDPTCRSAAP